MCITSDTLFMLMVSIRNSKCALPRTIVWTARRLDSGTPLPLPQTSLPWHHRPQPVSAGSGGTSQGAGAPCWAIRATPWCLATRTARQSIRTAGDRDRARSRRDRARPLTPQPTQQALLLCAGDVATSTACHAATKWRQTVPRGAQPHAAVSGDGGLKS